MSVFHQSREPGWPDEERRVRRRWNGRKTTARFARAG